jgi:hypothetical protein
MSTSSPSSSMICHQRALSLPQNSNLIVSGGVGAISRSEQSAAQAPVAVAAPQKGTKSLAIQPVHHRTRSLPLTEETAIDFSQSPPNFAKFSPFSAIDNNNSMESIVEDYGNMDVVNNNHRSNNNGGSSILKQLSKIANSNLASHNSNAAAVTSSPSQLRKKRQHHNVMTASLRSTYSNKHTHTKTVATYNLLLTDSLYSLLCHVPISFSLYHSLSRSCSS